VPVKVFTWPVTYVYSQSGLLLVYGIALVCALLCAAMGLRAFFNSKASYQNLFLTYLRVTDDSSLRDRLDPDDKGADPLPKAVATYCLTLSGHVDQGEQDGQDLELAETPNVDEGSETPHDIETLSIGTGRDDTHDEPEGGHACWERRMDGQTASLL